MTQLITDSFRLGAGQTLNFFNESAFRIEQPAGASTTALIIEGAAHVTTASSGAGFVNGVLVYDQLQRNTVLGVEITATGSLTVQSSSPDIWAWGIQGPSNSAALNLINNGLILVEGPHALAVSAGYRTSSVINGGTIKVVSTGEGAGVEFSGGATFRNTGQIDVQAGSHGSEGVFFTAGSGGGVSSFFNSGLIRVTDHTAAIDSYAVGWASPLAAGQAWENTGRIEGEYALKVIGLAAWYEGARFLNSGTMVGRVEMGDGATELTNSGLVQGDVDLGDGNDLYAGAAGRVTGELHAGLGTDSVSGGAAGERIFGDDGDDTIAGGGGADALDGGAGVDTLTFAGRQGVDADLDSGRVIDGVDTLSAVGFERVVGGQGSDTLSGTVGNNHMEGGDGADRLFGRAGDDTLVGGDGVSYLRGDEGDDIITGGAAFDDINGNMGADTAHGGLGDDWVVGGKDNDQLFGDEGGDIVYGNLGADTLDGGTGADLIRGGQGNDTISGGDGADWISGDRGSDTVAGGAGADVFHGFVDMGLDRVLDFSAADGDRVQLDAGTNYAVSQAGADVVVDLGPGDQLVLVGVQLSSLPAGWIFTA